MSSKRHAAVVGVAESDLGEAHGKNVLMLQAQAAKAALDEAGFTKDDVDALFTTGSWAHFPQLMLGEYLGIQPTYTGGTNIGGSSFESHAAHAVAAIKAGLIDVALITYGSTNRTNGSPSPTTLTQKYEEPFGIPSPAGHYAMAAMRHMHQYGTTSEQLAEIAVATRKWANLNEKAFKRDLITIEDVLESPMISEPLHLLDCCLITDGGGAVVIASKEAAQAAKKKPVWILGHGETHTHNSVTHMDDLTVTGAKQSGKQAMGMAGVTHNDIDVVEVYDSFTITVLLTLEALGFCKPGEGGDFVSGQRTAPGGSFPLNTNGGGLSYCHPGMFGIFLIIEAVRQLRGECEDRQVEDANIALVNGTGGTLSSTSTLVLGRD
ncbi:Acetyl-CoA acetyltransferase [Alteribacillus persepolensis]|uniref:Acetyl-CoA acetyltransferase n=1 Tax=Alteribacillus persepolensis TaxID=568899 RepID=A0A1G8AVL5_9BACI|nr:acetyl-CoA acetyltransferase [Alteribacillus persepolensis]SDH24937.1 Acetyl-CoA acetyltransferase [Alteribacillus persepolensis]